MFGQCPQRPRTHHHRHRLLSPSSGAWQRWRNCPRRSSVDGWSAPEVAIEVAGEGDHQAQSIGMRGSEQRLGAPADGGQLRGSQGRAPDDHGAGCGPRRPRGGAQAERRPILDPLVALPSARLVPLCVAAQLVVGGRPDPDEAPSVRGANLPVDQRDWSHQQASRRAALDV